MEKTVYIVWRDSYGNYLVSNIKYSKDLSEYSIDSFLNDAVSKEYGVTSENDAYVITVFTAQKNGKNFFYY